MNVLKTISGIGLLACLSFSCTKTTPINEAEIIEITDTLSIALAGNAYISQAPANSSTLITSNGLANWNNAAVVTSVYFKVGKAGTLNLAIKGRVPSGSSTAKITVQGQTDSIHMSENISKLYPIKPIKITEAGFIQVDIQGLTKTGSYFGDISDILISGSATTAEVIYVNNPDFYYWGRRGASTHLNYTMPTAKDILYFYNEVTVPTGNDVIGSYFMANGFSGGYFGMQVNSARERRILFSIWSPFQTDDPNAIPVEDQITLNRKGTDVYTGTFGNEGSGGQSYLVYPWTTGKTYQFLTKAEPDGSGKTDFTAWFKESSATEWQLIASWKRPKTVSYLKNLYSFLENFNTQTGHLTRMAQYGNQFAYSTVGQWHEVVDIYFTADETNRMNQRVDIKSGVQDNKFTLQINGFFNDHIAPKQYFSRNPNGISPIIDFNQLP